MKTTEERLALVDLPSVTKRVIEDFGPGKCYLVIHYEVVAVDDDNTLAMDVSVLGATETKDLIEE